MSKLSVIYQNAPKPFISLPQIVAQCLATPVGIKAQEDYLDGDSPTGNNLLDRGEVARVIRAEAKRLNLTIPVSVKDIKIVKLIRLKQRAVGLPIGRNGRILLNLESQPVEGSDAN